NQRSARARFYCMNGIEDRYRLTIPVEEALQFALGDSDLNYAAPSDELRRVMGALAVDSLEYSEQWREASIARSRLQEKWPDEFGLGAS
ncbi:MAG: hypothetical protein M3R10_07400, partial [Verrucomicrobiota bacterium]|nr:hypothetical protein [Verrucomicrobiota bacterium]